MAVIARPAPRPELRNAVLAALLKHDPRRLHTRSEPAKRGAGARCRPRRSNRCAREFGD